MVKQYERIKIRFSNLSYSFLFSLSLWLSVYILLEYARREKGYTRITDISNDLDYFFEIMIGALFFTTLSLIFISFFETSLIKQLDNLEHIIEKTQRKNKWYHAFIEDISRWEWVGYALVFIIISSIIHYFTYGYLIVQSYGWTFYLLSIIILLWPNVFITTWTGWLMLSQFFHIFNFTYIENKNPSMLCIGMDFERGMWFFSSKNRLGGLWKKILPVNTSPQPIKLDVWNSDRLGGLSPLFKISTIGIVLLSRIFAVLIPLFTTVNKSVGILLLALFYVIILFSYVLAVYDMKQVIRTEKRIYNHMFNNEIHSLVALSQEKHAKSVHDEILRKIEQQHKLKEKLTAIRDNPYSMISIFNLIIAAILPFISFITVIQILNSFNI